MNESSPDRVVDAVHWVDLLATMPGVSSILIQNKGKSPLQYYASEVPPDQMARNGLLLYPGATMSIAPTETVKGWVKVLGMRSDVLTELTLAIVITGR